MDAAAFDELSERDRQIVRDVRNGRPQKDIGAEHGISSARVGEIVGPFISVERRAEIRQAVTRAREDARVEAVYALFRADVPFHKIAQRLGISPDTARRCLNAHPDYRAPARKEPKKPSKPAVRQPKRDADDVAGQALALMAKGLTNTAIRTKLSLHHDRVVEIRERFEKARPVEVPAWVWRENHETYREIAALPDDEEGGEEAAAAWARRQQRSQRAVAEALAAREAR